MEQELLLKVLLSTVLGFIGGWLVKTVFSNNRLARAERDWQIQVKALTEARDAAGTKVRELRSRCNEMEASFGAVEKDMTRIRDSMEARERSIQGLKQDLLDAKGKIEETDQLRAGIAERDEKLRQLARMRAELIKNSVQSTELEAARLELETVVQRATHLESENAALNEERAQLIASAERLKDQQTALIEAASEVKPNDAALADQAAKIGELQSQVQTRDSMLAKLRAHNSELEQALEQAAPTNDTVNNEPGQESAESDLKRRLAAREQSIAELRNELQASRGMLSEFQQRVNQLERDQRRQQHGGEDPHQSASQEAASAEPAPSQPPASADRSVPLFYERPPQQIDDLTQIKGIGPVLATTLNSMGIFQFQQLANLNEDDIAVVTRKLRGFKDRIARDQWVSQAQRLVQSQS